MKLRNKALIVALTMNLLLSSTAAIADDACTPVVKACDKALADQDKVIDLKGKVITAQQNIIDAEDKQITELSKQSNNIFKSPLLYIIVGMVAGGLLVGRAK